MLWTFRLKFSRNLKFFKLVREFFYSLFVLTACLKEIVKIDKQNIFVLHC